MLDISINRERRKKVSGRYLAHNRAKPRTRARLARDIHDRRVDPTNFTWKQLATLCRVSIPTIKATSKPVNTAPGTFKDQWLAAQEKKTTTETLAEHFARSSRQEWLEFGRAIGPAKIWDELISPLV